MFYIASDHRGFALKEELKKYFQAQNITFTDLGPLEYVQTDDYPDYAIPLAERIVKENTLGVLICRTGAGVAIAANKVKGARAAQITDEENAVLARTDDDANIAVVPGQDTDLQGKAKLIETFLKTSFSNAERHIRRRNKIISYENQ
ncbi:MAG: RpiB/LacA/LacB family sugar-phosphate isomerase [bacterium]